MFKQARLKLTAWYLLILMSVTIFFSVVIHSMLLAQVSSFASEQRFRIERRFGPTQPEDTTYADFVENANHRIILTLFFINGGIFLVAGGLSFFLAGKTLKPIKNMIDDQNRFITDSSHELRTPLASLKIAMEVAQRNKNLTLKESRQLIVENLEEVNHLQELSDRLLNLTSGKISTALTPPQKVFLKKLIVEAIKNVSTLAKNKSVTLENKITTDQAVLGQPKKLKELFGILLENAIKYSPSQNAVIVSLHRRPKTVDISFEDHGIGIDGKDLPHIFDRFFRGDLARADDNTDGFGLGLSIAKKIAEEHGGSISVRSKINQGTTFTIHLPV